MTVVKYAGTASDMLLQSIFLLSPIIMAPTSTRMGAVAVCGTCVFLLGDCVVGWRESSPRFHSCSRIWLGR